MAVKEVKVKENKNFSPTLTITEDTDQLFVEFILEDNTSFMVSCHGNNILIRGYSPKGKHPNLEIVNPQEIKPGHTSQIIVRQEKKT